MRPSVLSRAASFSSSATFSSAATFGFCTRKAGKELCGRSFLFVLWRRGAVEDGSFPGKNQYAESRCSRLRFAGENVAMEFLVKVFLYCFEFIEYDVLFFFDFLQFFYEDVLLFFAFLQLFENDVLLFIVFDDVHHERAHARTHFVKGGLLN